MSILPKAVSQLIESFEHLPGVGTKTAQRFAFYLLHVPQGELDQFSDRIRRLKTATVLCSVCKNIAETDPCLVCGDSTRDHTVVCVVERPMDVLSIERTGKYRGVYHVLHGAIDPLNSIGPDEIYITDLLNRVRFRESNNQTISLITEVILATNSNMEGEATAMYIQKQLSAISLETRDKSSQPSAKIKVTRLAHGLPVGGDVEYADEVTLTRALEGRREY